MAHFSYFAASIIFAISSQLLIKWRMSTDFSSLPDPLNEKVRYLLTNVLFDPFIILALFFVMASGLCWMVVMTKTDLSYAGPLTSVIYVAHLVFGVLLFKESFTLYKMCGVMFIVAGVYLSSRSL